MSDEEKQKSQVDTYEYVPVEEEDFTSKSFISSADRNLDIVEDKLCPSSAFEKFAGKLFDCSNANFMSEVKGRQSPEVASTFQPNRPIPETPLQRYTRLSKELSEFKTEVAALAQMGGQELATLMSKEIEQLQASLEELTKDPSVAPFLDANFPLSHKDLTSKNTTADLLKQLENVPQSTTKPAAEKKTDGDAGMSYELYMRPDDSNKSGTVDLVSLDKRLCSLETLVGVNATEAASFPDIHSGIIALESKLSKLDATKMEPVMRKINNLLGELDTLEEQKTTIQGSKPNEHEASVQALYATMPKWDQAAQQLPLVVGRLQSLKDLSEVGSTATGKLETLEKEQADIDALVKSDRDAVGKLSQELNAAVAGIRTSVTEMEKKMEDLANKAPK